jgi:hypothetical protein
MIKNLTLIFIILSCFSFNLNGQIVQETTNYPTQLRFVHLEYSGYKYIYYDVATTQIRIYNLNHSVYKIITVPSQPNAYSITIQYVTERLFDNDSTDIEYAAIILQNPMPPGHYDTRIYDEFGNTLLSLDSATFWYGVGGHFGNPVSVPIMNTDSGTKMIFWRPYAPTPKSLIYCLPGRLENEQYVNGDCSGTTMGGDPNIITGPEMQNPYPNPTNNTTRIPFTLPEGETQGELVFYDVAGNEVKRFQVDNTFSEILVSSADLAPGTYYYNLQTSTRNSDGKTLVIIQ